MTLLREIVGTYLMVLELLWIKIVCELARHDRLERRSRVHELEDLDGLARSA